MLTSANSRQFDHRHQDGEQWPADDCSGDDARALPARYKRLEWLDLREGKLPTQLALSWEGKASFVLTDNLQFKKLSFLDGTEPDSLNTQGDDKFDANVVLSTGMLGPLIKDILDALGGENVFAEQASEAEGPPF